MAFYDVFERLCEERGTTPTGVARDNGIAQSSVATWKKRGSTPKAETVQKLADYFGVSVDYLLGKADLPSVAGTTETYQPWTKEDQMIFENLEGLTEKDKQLVLAMIDRLKQTGKESTVVITPSGPYYLYNFQDRAETAPESPPAPQGGKDTTPPPDAPETAPEGGIDDLTNR